MKYLLDTNICVYLLRGKYDMDKVIKKVGLDNCAISEITAFELIVGAELLRQKTGTDQVSQVQHFISSIKVIPIREVFTVAAQENARLRLAGTPLHDKFDLLIGCTSIYYDRVMVTENIKDFKDIKSISLENWVQRNNP